MVFPTHSVYLVRQPVAKLGILFAILEYYIPFIVRWVVVIVIQCMLVFNQQHN